MSKSQLSSRRVVSRIALFSVIAAFLMIFVLAGTNAAGFDFLSSVKDLLGIPSSSANIVTASAATIGDRAKAVLSDKQAAAPITVQGQVQEITVGRSYHNDVSPPLRDMVQMPIRPHLAGDESEANKNPEIANNHIDAPDTVVQSTMAPNAMPTPILSFNGIPFPGVACNCAPPDTDGEVGATQYVQMVNEGYQVLIR